MIEKVVVIGAPGLVGKSLISLLINVSSVKQIVAITRRPLTLNDDKLINHVIDFEQLTKHQALFQGDALFSCLGTTRKKAGSIAAQRVIDLDYQLITAQLAHRNKVKQLLLVSSSGANPYSNSPYLKMKGELEQQVKMLGFESITILQPSLLLGKRNERRLGEQLAALVMPIFTWLPGLTKYRAIPAGQVADKMLQLALTPYQGTRVVKLNQLFN